MQAQPKFQAGEDIRNKPNLSPALLIDPDRKTVRANIKDENQSHP